MGKDIKEYSDLVLKYVGRDDSIVTYKEAEPFTTKVKKIDCSKAIRDLGHDPKIPPEEGIRRTVERMKSIYQQRGVNKYDGDSAESRGKLQKRGDGNGRC